MTAADVRLRHQVDRAREPLTRAASSHRTSAGSTTEAASARNDLSSVDGDAIAVVATDGPLDVPAPGPDRVTAYLAQLRAMGRGRTGTRPVAGLGSACGSHARADRLLGGRPG